MASLAELEHALKIAHKILDGGHVIATSGPYADPDDDVHILARQFLRLYEREDARKRD